MTDTLSSGTAGVTRPDMTAAHGFFARHRTEIFAILLAVTIVAVWGAAIVNFGVPAVVYPLAVIVPSCVVMLIVLTRGKI